MPVLLAGVVCGVLLTRWIFRGGLSRHSLTPGQRGKLTVTISRLLSFATWHSFEPSESKPL
jgi:hypothetical protein